MLLGNAVPARVDELDEELVGTQGYGTLLVVPGGDSLNTSFRFALPEAVISHVSSSDPWVYRLRVQKQPGTLAHPLTIRIHLPHGTAVQSTSPTSVIEGSDILYKTDLRTDQEIDIVFRIE